MTDAFTLTPAPPAGTAAADRGESASADKDKSRVRGVAIAGRQPTVSAVPPPPQFPEVDPLQGYEPTEFDASDLRLINTELNRCRIRLFRISTAQRRAQRELREAELTYSRNMRRALIQTSGGTAETRRAVAEMECEPFEDRVAVAQQVVEELRKRAQDVRDDLKAVENLSHNARAQMNIT